MRKRPARQFPGGSSEGVRNRRFPATPGGRKIPDGLEFRRSFGTPPVRFSKAGPTVAHARAGARSRSPRTAEPASRRLRLRFLVPSTPASIRKRLRPRACRQRQGRPFFRAVWKNLAADGWADGRTHPRFQGVPGSVRTSERPNRGRRAPGQNPFSRRPERGVKIFRPLRRPSTVSVRSSAPIFRLVRSIPSRVLALLPPWTDRFRRAPDRRFVRRHFSPTGRAVRRFGRPFRAFRASKSVRPGKRIRPGTPDAPSSRICHEGRPPFPKSPANGRTFGNSDRIRPMRQVFRRSPFLPRSSSAVRTRMPTTRRERRKVPIRTRLAGCFEKKFPSFPSFHGLDGFEDRPGPFAFFRGIGDFRRISPDEGRFLRFAGFCGDPGSVVSPENSGRFGPEPANPQDSAAGKGYGAYEGASERFHNGFLSEVVSADGRVEGADIRNGYPNLGFPEDFGDFFDADFSRQFG